MLSLFPEEHTAQYLIDMTKWDLLKFKTELSSLCIFRRILSDSVLKALKRYFATYESGDTFSSVSAYSEFVCRLYEANGGNLTKHVEELCYDSENVYVKLIGEGKIPNEYMRTCVKQELLILSRLASLKKSDLIEPIRWDGFLPSFYSEEINLLERYDHRVHNIGKYGYGKYAHNPMFCIDESGTIVAVKNPDPISLDELVDYEIQRNRIIDNTKALLDGKPAANILLTGDAGTGKSSTVKAVVNAFYNDGLRIIEVRKDQLASIPKVLDELSQNPLKFILFIDDLSFLSDDDNFNGLKAVLEGSVSARSKNVVVYATSNRRHIIREKFSDRDSDDEVHRNDAMQEMISLSDRFGLHISFNKPDKKTYLDIVLNLAQKSGVSMPQDELCAQAERFALERGGRSARLARQFIDSILAKE